MRSTLRAMYNIFNSGVDNSNHHNNHDTFHASAQDKRKTLMKRAFSLFEEQKKFKETNKEKKKT